MLEDLDAGLPFSTDACRRCGLSHVGLDLRAFAPPILVADGVTMTHWAMCPLADAPILLLTAELE